MSAGRRVAVVDDNPHMRSMLGDICVSLNLEVAWFAADGAGAIENLRADPLIQLLILDRRLPDLDGIQLIKVTGACSLGCRTLLLSGFLGEDTELIEASEVLHKGGPLPELKAAILRLVGETRSEG